MAIAIRVVDLLPAGVLGWVIQKPGRSLANLFDIGSHQNCRASLYRFRPFGLFAQDQHGFAKRRSFLLYAARIRNQQIGAPGQVDERNIVQGLNQMNIGMIFQMTANRFGDVGIGMNGVDDSDVRPVSQLPQRDTDALKGFAKAFAAMRGNDDQFSGISLFKKAPIATTHRALFQLVAHV